MLKTSRTEDQPMTFYVAGGHVLAEVFGHGPCGHIDVWCQGKRVSKSGWIVPGGRGAYPVHIFAVRDPETRIECLDLQICQCAIQCQVLGAQRHYQLMLTPACFRALYLRVVRVTPLHAGVAGLWQLGLKMQKYAGRNLSVKDSDLKICQAAGSGQTCQTRTAVKPSCSMLSVPLYIQTPVNVRSAPPTRLTNCNRGNVVSWMTCLEHLVSHV